MKTETEVQEKLSKLKSAIKKLENRDNIKLIQLYAQIELVEWMLEEF